MSISTDRMVRFGIDSKASLFTVQAFAAGIVAVVAHSPKFAIRDFEGSIDYLPENLQVGSVSVTVKVNSFEIMDEVRSSERQEIERIMYDEVLERRLYPLVRYRSSRVNGIKIGENMYRYNVAGELTFHGVTRGLGLDAQVVAGEDTLRAQGSFSLSQTDFGLKIASVANATLKLKDELKFSYFVVARREN